MSSNGQGAPALTARLSDVTGLANLLKSVAIQTHAVVIASESGLEIVTELNRTLQAHAYLYSHMFESYEFRQPSRSKRTGDSRGSNVKKRSAKKPRRTDSQLDLSSDESPASEDAGSSQQGATQLEEEAAQEPASVSFEVSLQTWISCLNIFGGVGPSRPHAHGSLRPATSLDGQTRSYRRNREGTAETRSERGDYASADRQTMSSSSAGKSTRMKLTYEGEGHPLVLELEQEANVVTRCAISTYEPSFLTDMVFDPRNMVSQVIIGSELMHSAFSEIDQSCKKLSVLMTSPFVDTDRSSTNGATNRAVSASGRSMLRFKAISDTGSSEMEFPASISSSDPTGVIEKFIALPESSEQWYDFTLLAKTMTVFKSSIKTSIRMDEAGLISFQFMMPKYKKVGPGSPAPGADSEEQDAFCEFLCCPLDTNTLIL